MANSTITILQSIEWAKQFCWNEILSNGDYKEPAVTSANLVKQAMIAPPFSFRWNRTVTGFVCSPGVQDYLLGNWTASTGLKANFFVVDNNGNSQKVTTAGTTGSSLPSWNATTGGTTTDGTVTWTNQGPIPNASSTYSFWWIENASVQDTVSSKWFALSPKIDLSLDSSTMRPQNISAELDDGSGNITFRMLGVPDKAYPIAITVQQKPVLITSLNQTWGIPDEFSYVFQWGFLSFMFQFADDPRSAMAAQKFAMHLLSAADGLDSTAKNIWLNQWSALSGQPLINQMNLQQGVQSKSGQ